MSDTSQGKTGKGSARVYILVAAILVVAIVVTAFLLVTEGLPLLRKEGATPAASEGAATLAPTFTPGPPKEPTNTPPAMPSPTSAPPQMRDTGTPSFEFVSAGARPGVDWTGFFGQVLDAEGKALAGVPLIVWYNDGTPASGVVRTDAEGYYEIRLADAVLAGSWSIQVLTEDGQPASKLFSFRTDENTTNGIQQIQVLWRKMP